MSILLLMDGDVMNKSTILPEKLRGLRKAHSYTQDYVATALGIARQTYSHYETGKRTPDAETLYKLAGLYDISVDDLIQLTLSLDRNIYYDAPALTQSGEILDNFLNTLTVQKTRKSISILPILKRNFYITLKSLLRLIKKKSLNLRKSKPVNRNSQRHGKSVALAIVILQHY